MESNPSNARNTGKGKLGQMKVYTHTMSPVNINQWQPQRGHGVRMALHQSHMMPCRRYVLGPYCQQNEKLMHAR